MKLTFETCEELLVLIPTIVICIPVPDEELTELYEWDRKYISFQWLIFEIQLSWPNVKRNNQKTKLMNITIEQHKEVVAGRKAELMILQSLNDELEDRLSIQQQSLDNLRKENQRLEQVNLRLAGKKGKD